MVLSEFKKLAPVPLEISTSADAVGVVPSKVYKKLRYEFAPSNSEFGLDGSAKYNWLVDEPTRLRLVLFSGWIETLLTFTLEMDLYPVMSSGGEINPYLVRSLYIYHI